MAKRRKGGQLQWRNRACTAGSSDEPPIWCERKLQRVEALLATSAFYNRAWHDRIMRDMTEMKPIREWPDVGAMWRQAIVLGRLLRLSFKCTVEATAHMVRSDLCPACHGTPISGTPIVDDAEADVPLHCRQFELHDVQRDYATVSCSAGSTSHHAIPQHLTQLTCEKSAVGRQRKIKNNSTHVQDNSSDSHDVDWDYNIP